MNVRLQLHARPSGVETLLHLTGSIQEMTGHILNMFPSAWMRHVPRMIIVYDKHDAPNVYLGTLDLDKIEFRPSPALEQLVKVREEFTCSFTDVWL